MAWLTENQLLSFKSVGRGVKISDQAVIYGAHNVEIGDNVRIDAQTVILASSGSLKIGNHVHVAVGCLLAAGGGIRIGDFAGLSFGVNLISATDDTDGEFLVGPQFPDFLRGTKLGVINVEPYVFVGARSTVLPGCFLAIGSFIGANSLVIDDTVIQPWTKYFGSPVRRTGERRQDMVQKSVAAHEWWEEKIHRGDV